MGGESKALDRLLNRFHESLSSVVEESLEHEGDVASSTGEADRVKDVWQEERPEKCRRPRDSTHFRRLKTGEDKVKDQLGKHEKRERLLLLRQCLRRRLHGLVGIALDALGALGTHDALSRGHFGYQALRLRKKTAIKKRSRWWKSCRVKDAVEVRFLAGRSGAGGFDAVEHLQTGRCSCPKRTALLKKRRVGFLTSLWKAPEYQLPKHSIT